MGRIKRLIPLSALAGNIMAEACSPAFLNPASELLRQAASSNAAVQVCIMFESAFTIVTRAATEHGQLSGGGHALTVSQLA